MTISGRINAEYGRLHKIYKQGKKKGKELAEYTDFLPTISIFEAIKTANLYKLPSDEYKRINADNALEMVVYKTGVALGIKKESIRSLISDLRQQYTSGAYYARVARKETGRHPEFQLREQSQIQLVIKHARNIAVDKWESGNESNAYGEITKFAFDLGRIKYLKTNKL